MKTKFKLGPIQEKWLQSLEQHPERQMRFRLGRKQDDGSYMACCLGEGGLISGVCEWNDDGYLECKSGNEQCLTAPYYEALGLRDNGGAPITGNNEDALFSLNDSGKTWSEIAATIRANPEVYFEKSV